jgi:hypothetical protein
MISTLSPFAKLISGDLGPDDLGLANVTYRILTIISTRRQ